MQTRLISSHRIDGVKQVAWLGGDTLVATTNNYLIWLRLQGGTINEIRRSPHHCDWTALLALNNPDRAAFHSRNDTWAYSLQLIDVDGFYGSPHIAPFSWIQQVSASPSGSLLATFGSLLTPGRVGYIEPVNSCLIDMNSGDLQHLPYSAIAIKDNTMYFVKDRTVYRRKLAFLRSTHALDDTFSGDPLEVMASDKVLLLVPRDDYVWLATERGLFAANTMDVELVHKWDCAGRVCVCGDVFFATGIGPEVEVYDTRNRIASCVMSSSAAQVTGLDALRLSHGDDPDEGLLMVVSEKGVLDRFSWSSSREK
jgi:hypothetical protein